MEGTGGYIFRSASEKGEIEEIQAEMQRLQQLYEELKKKRGPRKGTVTTSSTGDFFRSCISRESD